MDYGIWALDQVKALRPEATTRMWPSVQELARALATLRDPKDGAQVFGLSVSNVPAASRPAVVEQIIAALIAWKEKLAAEKDVSTLLDLDKIGRRCDVPALRVSERFPLRCDPLGAREGLAPDWSRRLEKLDEAIAGRRVLDPAAVNMDEEGPIEFGARDEEGLYEYALRFETASRQMFPRELAALVWTANGVSVDETPLVRPIRDWTDDDHGLCIGSGSYFQGSLVIGVTKKAGLLSAKVVDRDDDGVVLAKYANLGAFFDALLGVG